MMQRSVVRAQRARPVPSLAAAAVLLGLALPAGAGQAAGGQAPADNRAQVGAMTLRPQELVAAATQLAPGAQQSAAPPTLKALVEEALRNNPELRAAGKEAEAANARVRPAGALEDPMFETGLLNVPIQPWRLNREDMTMKMLGLSQKLPYPGKRALREAVAARDAESAKYGLQETGNRVVRDVKLAYFDLALTDESIRQLKNNRLILEQFLRIAESRYSVGQATQAEVLKAQSQLARMDEELLRMQRERPVAQAELARQLGRRGDSSSIVATLPEVADVALDVGALGQTALRERPQLLGLASLIERSNKALQLARKEAKPDFDLRFSYGQREKNPLGVPREDVFSLTVAMNLPVWRKDKIEPRIAEAEAMREQSEEMQRAQQNDILAKLQQQAAVAEQSRKSVRLYDSAIVPQAKLSVEAALAAYKVSRIDLLMLLDSQMTLFGDHISRAKEAVNFNKALAEIELLTGKRMF